MKQSTALLWSLLFLGLFTEGCASSEALRLRRAREAYLSRDGISAQKELLSQEAEKASQSRVLHLFDLGRISFAAGDYASSVKYLTEGRALSDEKRADWKSFWNKSYSGTPWEYSWAHTALAISYSALADQEVNPARSADLRRKARAEVMLADSHLENLKRIFAGEDRYQEDPYVRLVGSFVHKSTGERQDHRIAELLAEKAPPAFRDRLKLGLKKGDSSLLALFDLGTLPQLKKRKFVIGLSTLFGAIEDPGLRRVVERIGLQVLLELAPEFGLIALSSAAVGAAEGEDGSEAPFYLSGAIDQAVGLVLEIPWLPEEKKSPGETALLQVEVTENQSVSTFPLVLACNYQSLIHHEYKVRESKEFRAKAISMGLQYLAILIPAIEAYSRVKGDGALLKKLGILASFYVAKRVIDLANAPDLRSWDLLPQYSYAGLVQLPTGKYRARLSFSDSQVNPSTRDLGTVEVREGQRFLLASDPSAF